MLEVLHDAARDIGQDLTLGLVPVMSGGSIYHCADADIDPVPRSDECGGIELGGWSYCTSGLCREAIVLRQVRNQEDIRLPNINLVLG